MNRRWWVGSVSSVAVVLVGLTVLGLVVGEEEVVPVRAPVVVAPVAPAPSLVPSAPSPEATEAGAVSAAMADCAVAQFVWSTEGRYDVVGWAACRGLSDAESDMVDRYVAGRLASATPSPPGLEEGAGVGPQRES